MLGNAGSGAVEHRYRFAQREHRDQLAALPGTRARFVLRVPLRYYRQPPAYFFLGWRSDAPPRWGQHWGNEWAQRRNGWDRWNRNAAPRLAPLPAYQREYSGKRYPQAEQQQALRNQNYHYQPHDPVVRQRYEAQRAQSAPPSGQRGTQVAPPERNSGQQGGQRSNPPQSAQQRAPTSPRTQPSQDRGENAQRSAPNQGVSQQPRPPVQQSQQPELRRQESGPQGKGDSQEPKRERAQGQGQGQDKDREGGDDRGQDHRR